LRPRRTAKQAETVCHGRIRDASRPDLDGSRSWRSVVLPRFGYAQGIVEDIDDHLGHQWANVTMRVIAPVKLVCLVSSRRNLIGPRIEYGLFQMANIVPMGDEIARQGVQQRLVRRRVAECKAINGLHQADTQVVTPDAIYERASEIRIVRRPHPLQEGN